MGNFMCLARHNVPCTAKNLSTIQNLKGVSELKTNFSLIPFSNFYCKLHLVNETILKELECLSAWILAGWEQHCGNFHLDLWWFYQLGQKFDISLHLDIFDALIVSNLHQNFGQNCQLQRIFLALAHSMCHKNRGKATYFLFSISSCSFFNRCSSAYSSG